MAFDSSVFTVLFIDHQIDELAIVSRVFKSLTNANIRVDHAFRCSEAVNLLMYQNYDLVLLDNHLSGQISAEFSVPFILSALGTASVAIISNDIDVPYLRDPEILGVDHVVEKADIVTFLRDQLALKLGSLTASRTPGTRDIDTPPHRSEHPKNAFTATAASVTSRDHERSSRISRTLV